MDDADLRGLDQRLADHLDQVGGLIGGIGPRARDRRVEGLRAVEQLGRDPRLVTRPRLPEAMHLRDARALHALELLELALEPLRDARQRDHRRRDDLDRARPCRSSCRSHGGPRRCGPPPSLAPRSNRAASASGPAACASSGTSRAASTGQKFASSLNCFWHLGQSFIAGSL